MELKFAPFPFFKFSFLERRDLDRPLAMIDLEMKRRWQWNISFLRAQREREREREGGRERDDSPSSFNFQATTDRSTVRRFIVPSRTFQMNVKTKLRDWRLLARACSTVADVCQRECRNVRCVINWNSFRRRDDWTVYPQARESARNDESSKKILAVRDERDGINKN